MNRGNDLSQRQTRMWQAINLDAPLLGHLGPGLIVVQRTTTWQQALQHTGVQGTALTCTTRDPSNVSTGDSRKLCNSGQSAGSLRRTFANSNNSTRFTKTTSNITQRPFSGIICKSCQESRLLPRCRHQQSAVQLVQTSRREGSNRGQSQATP